MYCNLGQSFNFMLSVCTVHTFMAMVPVYCLLITSPLLPHISLKDINMGPSSFSSNGITPNLCNCPETKTRDPLKIGIFWCICLVQKSTRLHSKSFWPSYKYCLASEQSYKLEGSLGLNILDLSAHHQTVQCHYSQLTAVLLWQILTA